MPRITITPSFAPTEDYQPPRFLDEDVLLLHLNDPHSSVQLLERIAWALDDAEQEEANFRR